MKTRRLILLFAGVVALASALLPTSAASAMPRFWDWESLGGNFQGAPTVASWGVGRMDVFVRGADDQLWQRYADFGWQGGWYPLGAPPGGLKSAPAAVSWGPDRIDIVGVGGDKALWHKWFDGSAWSGWESMGGVWDQPATIASLRNDRLDILATGQNHLVYRKRWTGFQWLDWVAVDSRTVAGAPAATSSTGQVVFAVRDFNNHVLVDSTSTQNDDNWNGFSDIGGDVRDDPGIAWRSTSRNVFVHGADGHLYMWSYDGANPPAWHMIGGILTSGPGATYQGSHYVEVFVRSTDNGLWHITAQEGPES